MGWFILIGAGLLFFGDLLWKDIVEGKGKEPENKPEGKKKLPPGHFEAEWPDGSVHRLDNLSLTDVSFFAPEDKKEEPQEREPSLYEKARTILPWL